MTSIGKTLADQITSFNPTKGRNTPLNKEENTQKAVNPDTLCDSDMVTSVTVNQQTNPQRPPPTIVHHDFDDIVTEIHNLRESMSDNVSQSKILQTQVPLFGGNRVKYKEFEHLLLIDQHRLTEEQNLTYFQILLRDDAIEFWLTLKLNTQTTLAQVLMHFKKEYAKEDLKEVVNDKFDQMRYDSTTETFNDFLNENKKVVKQAFDDRSADITQTFLFAKLPVHMLNELAIAGETRRVNRGYQDVGAEAMSIRATDAKHNQCSTLKPDRSATSRKPNIQFQQPTTTKPRNSLMGNPALRNPWPQVARTPKTPQTTEHNKAIDQKPTTNNRTDPKLRRQNQIH